jgi:hypothetical protein
MRSIGITVLAALASRAAGHGDHSDHGIQTPIVDENADWMTKHMAEEHHMTSWDASSFFTLHDYDSDGQWTAEELLRTYGLDDESNATVSSARRDEISAQLLGLLDTDGSGSVSRAEWIAFADDRGETLPDVGTGVGHHGDDEYEYEIHHWEKYHNDDTTLDELTHPEDIAHFKKHDQLEEQQERLEQLERMAIVEDNIPAKFRRMGL